jgi:hypothetical protein
MKDFINFRVKLGETTIVGEVINPGDNNGEGFNKVYLLHILTTNQMFAIEADDPDHALDNFVDSDDKAIAELAVPEDSWKTTKVAGKMKIKGPTVLNCEAFVLTELPKGEVKYFTEWAASQSMMSSNVANALVW